MTPAPTAMGAVIGGIPILGVPIFVPGIGPFGTSGGPGGTTAGAATMAGTSTSMTVLHFTLLPTISVCGVASRTAKGMDAWLRTTSRLVPVCTISGCGFSGARGAQLFARGWRLIALDSRNRGAISAPDLQWPPASSHAVRTPAKRLISDGFQT